MNMPIPMNDGKSKAKVKGDSIQDMTLSFNGATVSDVSEFMAELTAKPNHGLAQLNVAVRPMKGGAQVTVRVRSMDQAMKEIKNLVGTYGLEEPGISCDLGS
ncbi:MAG TPA: hypothetical protein DEA55_03605 [Rhodospirillaceae bacterium]|nr:hypothetical protein [Rhodospirillaceae bacterium]